MSAASPRPVDPADGQRAAADPAASVWVAAHAGSGKTRVLIDRVTRLLLGGTRPGAILCLTFTKAAAAEMANRLYKRLGEWSILPDAALNAVLAELLGAPPGDEMRARARCLFASVLDAKGRLRIQTIHAFCEALLKRFPLEAGVPPHFAVADESTAQELLDDARARLLVDAAGEPALAAALDHVVASIDEASFETVMRELVMGRRRLYRFLDAHGNDADAAIGAVFRRLGVGAAATRDDVIAGFVKALPAADLKRAAAALDQGSATDGKRAAAIRAWLDAADRAALIDDWLDVFLTAKGEPRAEKYLITKAGQKADPNALVVLQAEQARVLDLREALNALGVAEATAALIRLGKALLDRYEAEKSRQALLDYDDLILLTRALLTERSASPWVLYKLDGGLDHILVDEAQDTSPEQWEVIGALAEEFFVGVGARELRRTVFAVGDAKQSIFSFQGADPAAFAGMRSYFAERVAEAAQEFRPVDLAVSFRSAQAVLDAVDAIFREAEARDGVIEGDGELRHFAHRRGAAGLVELWPVVTAPEGEDADPWDAPLDYVGAASPPAELARRIVGTIAGWLRDREVLASRGRPIRAGDILILVRRRDAFFQEIVRALKQADVPVAGADRMVLAEQIAVMDLLALGAFALLPNDDLTLATVLKGPLFGFDDDDLFQLCWQRQGSLWRVLRARARESDKWRHAAEALAALLARADMTPPFEFYSRLLDRDGRRRFLARLGTEADDPIDEFLALALAYERQHPPSLQGFLAWFERGGVEVKRDMEQGRDEVRVMTVHGAKGLEADIVFLPDTCSAPSGRSDQRILWSADLPPLPLWPVRAGEDCALSAEARAEARAARDREYRRLLYVATTRARDRLYICGWHRDGPPDGTWYRLAETALKAMPGVTEIALPWGETGLRFATAQTDKPADAAAWPARVARETPPAWLRRAAPPEPAPPRPLAPSRPMAAEPAVRSPLGADDGHRFRRGRLVHRLLQTLPELSESARAAAARRFLSRPSLGLSDAEQDEIARETLRVLTMPDVAALFGPDALVEAPLAGIVGDQAIVGQVDRLLVTAGAVIVVDYKTNRPPPATEADVAPVYLAQMAAYRALLRRIYPGRPVACLLLWTDGPRLMALSDPLLDRHAP
jgi:ATP-dependent helicase/nuclease subunit A